MTHNSLGQKYAKFLHKLLIQPNLVKLQLKQFYLNGWISNYSIKLVTKI